MISVPVWAFVLLVLGCVPTSLALIGGIILLAMELGCLFYDLKHEREDR